MTAQPSQETVKPEPTQAYKILGELITDAQNASFKSGEWKNEKTHGRYADCLDASLVARKALVAHVRSIEAAATQKLEAEKAELRAPNVYRPELAKQIWDDLQAIAPWAESNDMDWEDEILCGIRGAKLTIDQLRSQLEGMNEALGYGIRLIKSYDVIRDRAVLRMLEEALTTQPQPAAGMEGGK